MSEQDAPRGTDREHDLEQTEVDHLEITEAGVVNGDATAEAGTEAGMNVNRPSSPIPFSGDPANQRLRDARCHRRADATPLASSTKRSTLHR